MFRKQSLSDELFLHFFFESSEFDRVFNYLHDSNSNFRAGRIKSENFFGRTVMTALAPAFRSVDHIAGLNLNYRKCCSGQYGTEGRESLWHWISENCEEFREMQIVRHAKYVGTMIGPEGHIHRWLAPRKNIQRVLKINASTKSLVVRLCAAEIIF